MKALFLSLMLIGIAHAQTAGDDRISRLLSPPGVDVLLGHTACVGNAFNADSSIVGTCRVVHSGACSGRGCQPVTYTTTYIANWDAEGNGMSAIACSVLRHHLPQPNTIVYAPGYDATNCPMLNFYGTGNVILIDGVPLWLVAIGSGGQELVNDNVSGFLFTP